MDMPSFLSKIMEKKYQKHVYMMTEEEYTEWKEKERKKDIRN
jgi:hypothetical protein